MIRHFLALVLLAAFGVSCGSTASESKKKESKTEVATVAVTPEPAFRTAKAVNIFPHATDSYTQGLLVHNGKMYESTGTYGESKLRVSDIESGKVEREVALPARYFGEGLALLNDKLYQLTWMEGKCFVWDVNTLKQVETLSYDGEGWGLVAYGDKLLMSDGTSELKVIDPKDFRVISTIEVRDNRGKVKMINELEIIDSMLYANLYLSPLVAVINLESGEVVEYIDCSKISRQIGNSKTADVLNGIAYDSTTKKMYFTGKLWDSMFEIER